MTGAKTEIIEISSVKSLPTVFNEYMMPNNKVEQFIAERLSEEPIVYVMRDWFRGNTKIVTPVPESTVAVQTRTDFSDTWKDEVEQWYKDQGKKRRRKHKVTREEIAEAMGNLTPSGQRRNKGTRSKSKKK